MKKEKSCGSIVIKDNKVLLVKHKAGHWDFPKGHVEKGETEEETAIREVKEETNIDIDVVTKYRYVSTYSPKQDVIKDVIYFLGIPKNTDTLAQEEEVDQVLFIEINKALSIITYNNSRNILKQVIKDIQISTYS